MLVHVYFPCNVFYDKTHERNSEPLKESNLSVTGRGL